MRDWYVLYRHGKRPASPLFRAITRALLARPNVSCIGSPRPAVTLNPRDLTYGGVLLLLSTQLFFLNIGLNLSQIMRRRKVFLPRIPTLTCTYT